MLGPVKKSPGNRHNALASIHDDSPAQLPSTLPRPCNSSSGLPAWQ